MLVRVHCVAAVFEVLFQCANISSVLCIFIDVVYLRIDNIFIIHNNSAHILYTKPFCFISRLLENVMRNDCIASVFNVESDCITAYCIPYVFHKQITIVCVLTVTVLLFVRRL